jgi:hypothetical protein
MKPQGSIGRSMELLEMQYSHSSNVKNACVLSSWGLTTKLHPTVECQHGDRQEFTQVEKLHI